MYSNVNTMKNDIESILHEPDRCLTTEEEVMLLVDHCLDVFIICDFQLPTHLRDQLETCRCPINEFMDYVFAILSPDGDECPILTARH